MELKINLNNTDPVGAESSTTVPRAQQDVFEFIASRFPENYPKWMSDVIELEMIDPEPIAQGSRLKQVRLENNETITSTFEIRTFEPHEHFSFQGLDMPYRQVYRIDPLNSEETRITFRFEILEVDLFMRPFVKLIRSAMEEGVESTLSALNGLIGSANTSTP